MRHADKAPQFSDIDADGDGEATMEEFMTMRRAMMEKRRAERMAQRPRMQGPMGPGPRMQGPMGPGPRMQGPMGPGPRMGMGPGRHKQGGCMHGMGKGHRGMHGKGKPRHSFQDLETALIAVQENTIHQEHLQARGARIIAFETAGKALDAVLDGTADVTFGSPDFLENRVYRTSRALTILGSEPLDAGGAAAAFRKEDRALRASFDDALARLTADGTLDRLNAKWFEPSRDI